MWRLLVVTVLGFLSALPTNAAPTIQLEKPRTTLPHGWTFHHNASASDTLTLYIALKEPKIRDLKDHLHQHQRDSHHHRRSSSSPKPPNHLTRAQVAQYRQPDNNAVKDVSSWLKSNGIRNTRVYGGGSWISFDASVKTLRDVFEAKQPAYYVHASRPKTPVLRALSYTVPKSLRGDIDFVHPLTNFMAPRKREGSSHWHPSPSPYPDDPEYEPDQPCLTGTFPECIKKLYNITYEAPVPSPSRFGLAGFLEQWIQHSDVRSFMSTYTPDILSAGAPYNFTVELLNNGTNPQSDDPSYAGIEASLDVEYAMALGYPTAVTYYMTGGRGVKLDGNGVPLPVEESDNEPYLEFLLALLDKKDEQLPHVLSISYADDEQGVPLAYALKVCDLLAALTARGVSIFAATGDGGAGGTGQTGCISNDGTSKRMFMPTFPASCPYVTAVGAVDKAGPPLTAAAFSTGGFSNYFARPEWQDEIIKPFVDGMVRGNDKRLGMFNQTGRAMPDISAIGSGFQILYGGQMIEVLGTSASTPVVAAMVALVNDKRLREGKPSLGWLSPGLYEREVREVLKDVAYGQSEGCNYADRTGMPGWPAVEGWDGVTGLGVVGDFNDLLRVLG
ncbi:peptidase S8/S53 domain-containing protein [Bombardia bombarda]|uniref:tripeptidyl-peptidase II n=1 Tax=Bombardia bombarda TaxID=252184 RepID=A0AA39WV04_9PEZI|nr:peptidase S8/S53 domain-containing protein [Bombardia bombarda]